MKLILTLGLLLGIQIISAQNSTCIYTPYAKLFPPPFSPGNGGNAISNANFELGNLSGWNTLPNASRVVLVSNAHNSNYAAKLLSKNSNQGDAFLDQQIYNLVPGNNYTISCWLKASDPSTLASLQIRFNYPASNYTVLQLPITASNTWTKYNFNFTVPNTPNLLVNMVQIVNYRGQNANLFVDDIELITPATGFTFLNAIIPQAPQELTEDFKGNTGTSLNQSKWLVVRKTWGNSYTLNNNGVVPENLELLCTGGLRFHGHGDTYNGPIQGATTHLGNGKIRVGSCIATKDYYASGKYDVVAKLAPGMVNAYWNFHYIEDAAYQNGGIKNSEIDWEFPSNAVNGVKTDIVDGLTNSWGGLCDGVGISTSGISYQVPLNLSNATSAFHKYSIEWHTGGNGIQPSIAWFIDDVLIQQETNPTYIPFRASRFWLGVWYGNLNWIAGGNASLLQYNDRFMEVQSVHITPYYEANDIYENETDPFIGFDQPTAYPLFPCNSLAQKINNVSASEIETNVEAELTCYPIPPTDKLFITLNHAEDGINWFQIRDFSGRIIQSKSTNPNDPIQQINTGDLTKGFYFIDVRSSAGQWYHQKIQL